MNISEYLNIERPIENLHSEFKDAIPFSHVVIDNFLCPELAKKIASEFPDMNDSIWFEYNNPIEKKLACDDIRQFPASIAKSIHFLNSSAFLEYIEKITDIKQLQSDPYLHGGGIHCTKTGGKLDMHLDYSIHPKLYLERRLNLILYLSQAWLPEWGGELEFWNKDMTRCERKLPVKFNRAVIFETGDISYHGHPDPSTSPDNVSRNSIALYYLTEPRPNCSLRPRASFVARPQDDKSQELEEFRAKRSSVLGVY